MIIIYFLAILVIILFLSLHSPEVKGKLSEKKVAHLLNINSFFSEDKDSSKTLTNVLIPCDNGYTSEIDIIHLTKKGIFVIENKNYAGYIFGHEKDKYWTVTLYSPRRKTVEKFKFYNPTWQNYNHIKNLKKYLNYDLKIYSLIAFSNRGILKNIKITSDYTYVCNHSLLRSYINKIKKNSSENLSNSQIDRIYKRLLPLSNINQEIKQNHINNIKNRFESKTICPKCGGNLVVRTVKRGPNIGKKFLGCSNYPKCKFTKNI